MNEPQGTGLPRISTEEVAALKAQALREQMQGGAGTVGAAQPTMAAEGAVLNARDAAFAGAPAAAGLEGAGATAPETNFEEANVDFTQSGMGRGQAGSMVMPLGGGPQPPPGLPPVPPQQGIPEAVPGMTVDPGMPGSVLTPAVPVVPPATTPQPPPGLPPTTPAPMPAPLQVPQAPMLPPQPQPPALPPTAPPPPMPPAMPMGLPQPDPYAQQGYLGYQEAPATFREQPVSRLDPVSKCRYACDILGQLFIMLRNKGVVPGAYMMVRVNDFLSACGYQRLR
jgi:hypothetical protein